MKTDLNIYPVLPLLTLPPVGGIYTDPVFGTTIKRVTDASKTIDVGAGDGRKLWAAQVEYAPITPFNIDGTKLLLEYASYFVLFSGEGEFLYNPLVDGRYEINASSEPRWSGKDPNIFYYLHGNEFKVFDVSSKTAKVARKFTEYVVENPLVSGQNGVRSMGKGDISHTGQWITLCGRKDGSSPLEIFRYDIFNDKKGLVMSVPEAMFNLFTTPDGNVAIGWYPTGTDRFQGIELYDGNMNFLRQLAQVSPHQCFGRDKNGDEVTIVDGGNIIGDDAVARIRLVDGSKSVVFTQNPKWIQALHICVPRVPGWALVSCYTSNEKDYATTGLFVNEVFMISMDGKQVERLCHHHSIPFSYTHTPRATGNADLSKVVFNSCMGNTDPNYTDVFMMKVTPVGKVMQPPTGGPNTTPPTTGFDWTSKEIVVRPKADGTADQIIRDRTK